MRRYAILAPERFADDAKTAHGVIAYGADETAVVIDPATAGQRVRDVLPYLHCDAPIVATVSEALAYAPTSLLIGTAPQGGALPASWRTMVIEALRARLEIVSGLHDLLAQDGEFARVAREAGTTIWDVRIPPDVPLFSGAVYDVAPPVALLVGSDCAVGKMTVALELTRAAQRAGTRAEFVPTGQTGIMIAGWGIAVDRVISDFACGAAEQLVLEAARREPDAIIVEGQGSINHPAYAPVTLSLMYGSAPDVLLLVVDPSRPTIANFPAPRMSYRELITMHEALLDLVKPARVSAIALNTRAFDDAGARAEIERAREETALPVDDVVRYGADALWSAFAPSLVKTQPRRI